MRLSRIYSNTGWILLGSAFNKISSIILLVILTRYLGVEGFGRFAFAFFYVHLFGSIAEFGLTPILTKYISQGISRPGEVQGKGIVLGLICTALAILFAWIGTYILGYENHLRFLIMAASLGLFISFRDVTFRWILEVPFRAKLKMVSPIVLGILSELLGLLLVLFVVYRKGSLESILIVYVLSNLPGFIWLSIISSREIKPSLQTYSIPLRIRPTSKYDYASVDSATTYPYKNNGLSPQGSISAIEILKEATPIGISNILRIVYLMFGLLVLFQFKGAVDIGYYALAFRLATSLRIIPESIMHSLFPLISKAHVEEPERARALFKTATRYGSLIAFPLALGTMVVAAPVVILLGGKQFQPAAMALSILIWATFFAFFNTVLHFTFNAISMQKYNFNVSIVMATVSILLAFILIPRYGFIGASYSLTASECIGFIYALIIARALGLTFPVKNLGKNLFASIVMAISIWFLPPLTLQLLLGFIIYIVVTLLIKGIDKEDLFKLLSPAKMSKEILR